MPDGKKIRITIEKTGRAIYTSHLDMMRNLARAMTRAGLPMWHTEGFNPHPYLSLVRPLGLGFESRVELCELVMIERMDDAELLERLNAALPEGLCASKVSHEFRNAREIIYSGYIIHAEIDGEPSEAVERMKMLVGKPLMVDKRRKSGKTDPVDITPMIMRFNAKECAGEVRIDAVLKDSPDGGLSPNYLIEAFRANGVEVDFFRVERTVFFDALLKTVE